MSKYKKTVLVTGGAGFIGSHLCELLLERDYDVLCLDNFYTGRKKNIKKLIDNPSFEYIRHDITQPILLEVDWIFNFACPASPVHYQYNPVKTVKTNVMGAIHMLGLAKRVKARILQASTSEVYGNPEMHPQKEEYWGNVNPIGIRSCYDEGKRIAETLFMDYHRQNQVDIRIIRIFNTYGPKMRENDGRVVSNFIVQALRDEPLTVYGDGKQTRSFCYVSDLLNGILAVMESDYGQPLNLGNPQEYSILELANKIIKLTESSSELVHKEKPLDDPIRRKPDISKVKKITGWEPLVDLDQGLLKTIEYFRKILNIPVK